MKDIDHPYPDLDEVCVRCGAHFGEFPDDDLTEAICPSCYDDMLECKNCGNRFDELDENDLCESCAEEKAEDAKSEYRKALEYIVPRLQDYRTHNEDNSDVWFSIKCSRDYEAIQAITRLVEKEEKENECSSTASLTEST